MVTDVRQPQRLRLRDQRPRTPRPRGRSPMFPRGIGFDPGGEEVGEILTRLVKHADRGVPGSGQIPRDVEQAVKDVLELALGNERATSIDQASQAILVQNSTP